MKKMMILLLCAAAMLFSACAFAETDGQKLEIALHIQQRSGRGYARAAKSPLFPAYCTQQTWPDEGEYWDGVVHGALDRIVTVENKGNVNAYVRVWLAFEADTTQSGLNLIHLNRNSADWTYTTLGKTTIDGDDYAVIVADCKTGLVPGATTAPSLMQIAMDGRADNAYCAQFGRDLEYTLLAVAQAASEDVYDTPKLADLPWKNQ